MMAPVIEFMPKHGNLKYVIASRATLGLWSTLPEYVPNFLKIWILYLKYLIMSLLPNLSPKSYKTLCQIPNLTKQINYLYDL